MNIAAIGGVMLASRPRPHRRLAATPPPEKPKRPILSMPDYIRQIRAHRRRMAAAGAHFRLPDGGWLPATRLLQTLLIVHDVEKWLFLPLLIIFRCGRGNRTLAHAVYWTMNRVGDCIALAMVVGHNRDDVDWARRWEKIIDCLDRHLDPVARIELGDNSPPLTQFLSDRDISESRWLAMEWPWTTSLSSASESTPT